MVLVVGMAMLLIVVGIPIFLPAQLTKRLDRKIRMIIGRIRFAIIMMFFVARINCFSFMG